MEAAEVLGTEDVVELRAIYRVALADLLQALERGAIVENDYYWLAVGQVYATGDGALPGILEPEQWAYDETYTFHWTGSTVTAAEPQGKWLPLFG